MANRKSILYVSTKVSQEADLYIDQIMNDLNIKVEVMNTLHEVFPRLSDPSFTPDIIAINVEDFYNIKGIDVFDIVSTLSTLIKCTVERKDNKTKKRTTKLFAVVGDTTDPVLIKGMMTLPEVHLAMRVGGSFTYDDIKENVQQFLFAGDYSIPKKIANLLKPKKSKSINNHHVVKLTPRQTQILSIVVTRGVSNKVIAKMLNLSESTVKLHLSAIYKKYGVKNRTQLAVFSKDII